MRVSRWLLSLVLLTTSAAPQQSAPPPANPPAENTSLEDTMKFIQDKLNAVGRVNYSVYWHDNANETSGTVQVSMEESNVVANPSDCWIRYRLRLVDGPAANDVDKGFYLPDVKDLAVRTGEQYASKHYLDNGYPTVDAKIDHPIFWVVAQRPEDNSRLSKWRGAGEDAFLFTNEETAHRVAKAMQRAIQLCGGEQKEASAR